MPGYIGYTPEFTPISLQEYLTVPMMIMEGRQKEADKAEAFRDKISYYRDLLGPEASEVFEPYDNLLNKTENDIYNSRTQDLASEAKQLRQILRGISTKADLAKENRDKYKEMMEKDPSLIGDLGTMYDWYKDPYRIVDLISGKDLAAQIGGLTKNIASTIEPQFRSEDKKTGIALYETGINPAEQASAINNAFAGIATTDLEKGIRDYLDSINYDNLSPSMQKKIRNNVVQSVAGNSGFGQFQFDTVAKRQKEAAIAHTNEQTKAIREERVKSGYSEWSDEGVSVDDKGNKVTQHYKYRSIADKTASGYNKVERMPIDSNGKSLGGWEPAPYYIRYNGTREEAVYTNMGLFGKPAEAAKATAEKQYGSIYQTINSDGKVIDAPTMSFDDTERYIDVDMNDDKQANQMAILRNKYATIPYQLLEFKYDKGSKTVVVKAPIQFKDYTSIYSSNGNDWQPTITN